MRSRIRALLGVLSALSLIIGSFSLAYASAAGPPDNPHDQEQSQSENSEAEITVTWSEDCTDFTVESTKDISFVSINYSDDFTYEKFEDIDEPSYTHEGDKPIKSIVVKSGTTTLVFNCGQSEADPDEDPECSDGMDNDGDEEIDHPADPGCETPDDDDERDPDRECPDRDGDGVCDADDRCPDEPGTPENDGCPQECPDRDGDGVCDADDRCPDEPGTPENDGCPEEDPCTADAGDPGLPLTEDTLGQTIWDSGGDALSPLTEDPDGDGLVTGPVKDGGTDTPLEPATDEVACAGDLLIDQEDSPVDP